MSLRPGASLAKMETMTMCRFDQWITARQWCQPIQQLWRRDRGLLRGVSTGASSHAPMT